MEPPKTRVQASKKRSFLELQAAEPTLRQQSSNSSLSIKSARKKLKPSIDLGADFWTQAAALAKQELDHLDLVEPLERYEHLRAGGTEEDWLAEHETFDNKRAILEEKIRRYGDQASRVSESPGTPKERTMQQSYVSFFLSSPLGGDITVAAGRRDTSQQSTFRRNVMSAYHTIPGPENVGLAWDVIEGKVVSATNLTASHLFAFRHGAATLTTIFGEEAKDDLWSAANGLCLPTELEMHLEKGIFTIYPDFPDDATTEQRLAWHNSEPKEYRIRFLDIPERPTNPKASLPLYFQYFQPNIKYGDLNGQRLKFQNDARPKARYIYFLFLVNLLRVTWNKKEKATSILEPELGHPYWGTPGAYIQEGLLPTFTKQIGHIVPDIEQGVPMASTPTPRGVEDVLVESLESQVLESLAPRAHDESDEESDEEDY